MKRIRNRTNGFSHVEAVIIVLVLAVIGFAVFWVMTTDSVDTAVPTETVDEINSVENELEELDLEDLDTSELDAAEEDLL